MKYRVVGYQNRSSDKDFEFFFDTREKALQCARELACNYGLPTRYKTVNHLPQNFVTGWDCRNGIVEVYFEQ